MIPFLKISQVSSVVAPLFAAVTVSINVLAQSCLAVLSSHGSTYTLCVVAVGCIPALCRC